MSGQAWFPLTVRSTFSILKGLPATDEFSPALKRAGYDGCGLADCGNLAAAPTFVADMQKTGLRPIVGCEFAVVDDPTVKPKGPSAFASLTVLSRNQAGWKRLMKAVSLSNNPSRHHHRPRIALRELAELAGPDWYVLLGKPGTTLADSLFTCPRSAYLSHSFEEASSYLRGGWGDSYLSSLDDHLSLFGDSVRLECLLSDPESLPYQRLCAAAVRMAGKRKGIPVFAGADTHYFDREDAADQRVLACIGMKVVTRQVWDVLPKQEDSLLPSFFRSSSFHLPSLEELRQRHPEGELRAAVDIAAGCEAPVVGGPIQAPVFPCPDGLSAEEHFTQLCRDGWKKKVDPLLKSFPPSFRSQKKKEYADRIKTELEVLCGYGFASYFLVVQDYVRHAREDLKSFVGPGRGSVGGSLAAYLLDITRADPIEHDLMFERFVNKGRLQPGRSAPPDIDLDFQKEARPLIFEYLKGKYGPDCVMQMGTFLKLKGKSGLRDVLRIHGRCSRDEIDVITKPIPGDAAISDELEEMSHRENEDETGIIRWALENEADALREWCFINKDGELDGDFAGDFAQAMRLEGRCKAMGKHASGIVITPVPVWDLVPLAYDKGEDAICTGYDMRDSELAGLLKVDCLGLQTLDVLSTFNRFMRTGSVD